MTCFAAAPIWRASTVGLLNFLTVVFSASGGLKMSLYIFSIVPGMPTVSLAVNRAPCLTSFLDSSPSLAV